MAADGWHPRHFALMSDPALEALAAIYEAVELAGVWPPQWRRITHVLLPKPAGGVRAIGIFPGPTRLYTRVRRDIPRRGERCLGP